MTEKNESEIVDVAEPDDGLNKLERAFVEAYCSEESPSFGKGTQSAELAGYKSPRDAHWKIRQRPRVQEAMKKRYGMVMQNVTESLVALRRLSRLAEEAGDFGAAIRAQELLAKSAGAFCERLVLLNQTQAKHEFQFNVDDAALAKVMGKALIAHHIESNLQNRDTQAAMPALPAATNMKG